MFLRSKFLVAVEFWANQQSRLNVCHPQTFPVSHALYQAKTRVQSVSTFQELMWYLLQHAVFGVTNADAWRRGRRRTCGGLLPLDDDGRSSAGDISYERLAQEKLISGMS
jgi:hypothetical protein